uniref:Uncharacterized protein n=1 Tax=Vitis vinifera TaxID=29760 RepID=F6I3F7_VITVI
MANPITKVSYCRRKNCKIGSDFRNRLVNMLVNRILKHKKIIGLSNYLLIREQDSTKDRNQSTIYFTSSNTWSNSRYSSKSKTCRWIDSSSSH